LVVAFVAGEVRILGTGGLTGGLLEVEAVACLEALYRMSNVAIHLVVHSAIVADCDEASINNTCSDIVSDLDVGARSSIQSTDRVTRTLVDDVILIILKSFSFDDTTYNIAFHSDVPGTVQNKTHGSELEQVVVCD